jgi:exocyst complex component 6
MTFQGWGYSVSTLDNFLLKLFEKYAELLKRRFSDDFQEVRKTNCQVRHEANLL